MAWVGLEKAPFLPFKCPQLVSQTADLNPVLFDFSVVITSAPISSNVQPMFNEVDSIFVHAHPSPPNKQQLPPSPTSEMEVIHTCLFSSKCFKKTNLGCLSAQCRIFPRQAIWENSIHKPRGCFSGYKQLFEMLVSWLRKPLFLLTSSHYA